MGQDIKDILQQTLRALKQLLELFRFERIIHLVVGIIAFLMLLYAIVLLFRSNEINTALLISLFGSSGLITISSARITYFFNKAFKLVEDVIRSALKSDEPRQALDSIQHINHSLRPSVLSSIALMLIGVVTVIGASVYSRVMLKPLESQITVKQDAIAKLEGKMNDLWQTTKQLKPKFGIILETDTDLRDAKTNVSTKGHDFDSVYLFKDAAGYKTIAVFDSWEKAKRRQAKALEVNETANEIQDFSVWCSSPKWIETGEYFDCSNQQF